MSETVIKALWVKDIEELLESDEFSDWYRQYLNFRQALKQAYQRRDDLIIQAAMIKHKAELTNQMADDKLFQAGEFEDQATRSQVAYNEIENSSFEILSDFEQQRMRATEYWTELSHAEKKLEDYRQVASDLKARIDALINERRVEASIEIDKLRQRLEEVRQSIQSMVHDVDIHRDREKKAVEKKEKIWSQVEDTWSNSFVINITRTEYQYENRKLQRESEELHDKSTAERRRTTQLEQEAQAMLPGLRNMEIDLNNLLEIGRRRFGCSLVKEFMCWPHKEDVRSALCVPLNEHHEHFNIQLAALQIYKIDRASGLNFIEPLAEIDRDGGSRDSRLDNFFDREES